MAEHDEQDDLEALIGSAGWNRLNTWAHLEFEARLQNGIANALAERDNAIGLDKLRQVYAAKEAIATLLEYPRQRLATLERAEDGQVTTGSRRGRL
jgi:hypothetical protein